MNKKVLVTIIVVVVLIGIGLYLKKNSKSPSSIQPESSERETINILSPRGEDSWFIGDTQTIKWSAPDTFKSVNITLLGKLTRCDEGQYSGCYLNGKYLTGEANIISYDIALGAPNSGTYNWKITDDAIQGANIELFKEFGVDIEYRIFICDVDIETAIPCQKADKESNIFKILLK